MKKEIDQLELGKFVVSNVHNGNTSDRAPYYSKWMSSLYENLLKMVLLQQLSQFTLSKFTENGIYFLFQYTLFNFMHNLFALLQ